MLEVKPTT